MLCCLQVVSAENSWLPNLFVLAPAPGLGAKLIIFGVNDVHLVEFPQAGPHEDEESVEGLPPGLPSGPFSVSKSTTSSFNISTLRPRRRASAPLDVASSDDPVEELGEVARVLAEEPLLGDTMPNRTAGAAPMETNMAGDAVGCACGAVENMVNERGWVQ